MKVVICRRSHVVEETLGDLSLTTPGVTYKKWRDVYLNELLHQELSRNSVGSWHGEVLNWLRGINLLSDVFSLEFDPLFETVLLDIDVVVENSTLGGELDDLPFVFPPVREAPSVVYAVLFSEAATETPDTGEHEDILKTFNVAGIQDRLEKFANCHNLLNVTSGHGVFE